MSLQIATFEDACDIVGVRPGDVGHGVAIDPVGIFGQGWFEHRSADGDLLSLGVFANLITDLGDQYYGDRAAGISGAPGQVTGMKLGTGATAVAKTGAGSGIVAYAGTGVTASKAIDGTWPQSSLPGGAGTARQIQWRTSWAAGQVTVNSLAEVVLTNESALADDAGTSGASTQDAGGPGNSIARALLSPVVNKGASDTLTVTWNHNLLGA